MLRGRDMRRNGLHAALLELVSQHSDLGFVAGARRMLVAWDSQEFASARPRQAKFVFALRQIQGAERSGAGEDIDLVQSRILGQRTLPSF